MGNRKQLQCMCQNSETFLYTEVTVNTCTRTKFNVFKDQAGGI